jgi:hypothetical protein
LISGGHDDVIQFDSHLRTFFGCRDW